MVGQAGQSFGGRTVCHHRCRQQRPHALQCAVRRGLVMLRTVQHANVCRSVKIQLEGRRVTNYAREIAAADYLQIRMLTVPFDDKTLSFSPKRDCGGTWVVCSPETVSDFAAVPYFFGRKLCQDRKVPIGLLNDTLGGSQVEPWISAETFRTDACLQSFTEAWENAGQRIRRRSRRIRRWKTRGPMDTSLSLPDCITAWSLRWYRMAFVE